MQGYEWAEQNIHTRASEDLSSPKALQEAGVQVHFAPQIPSGQKLVNLASGRVEQFFDGEERPDSGYFAEFDSLERYSRREGAPLTEVDGQAVMLPTAGADAAGDPLSKEGH